MCVQKTKSYSKLKAGLVLCLIVALAAVAIAFLPGEKVAANALDTSAVLYHHFDYPSAITSDGRDIFIANGTTGGLRTTIYRYGLSTDGLLRQVSRVIDVDGSVYQLIVSNNIFFMLLRRPQAHTLTIAAYYITNRNIPVSLGDSPVSSFTSIALANNRLFATSNNNIVYEFAILGTTSVNFVVFHAVTTGGNSAIDGLLGINNVLYIARTEGTNLILRGFEATEFFPPRENSLRNLFGAFPFNSMHSFSGEIAVFAAGRIMLVDEAINLPPTNLDNGGFSPTMVASTTLNNRIYKLMANGSLYSYSVELLADINVRTLTNRIHLVASRSNILGFYDSPSDTASSGGRIFIADTNNNRLIINSGTGEYVQAFLGAYSHPTSVAARYGMLYVAHSLEMQNPRRFYNVLGVFNIAGGALTRLQTITFMPSGSTTSVPIKSVRACSEGYVYVLAQGGTLWRYATSFGAIIQDSLSLTAVGQEEVIAIEPALWRPGLYVAKTATLGDGQSVVRLVNGGTVLQAIPALSNLEGVLDIAPDSDGAVYVLQARYNATGDSIFRLTYFSANTVTSPMGAGAYIYIESLAASERHSDRLFSPSRIHLSGVEFREDSRDSAIAHRDILITDTLRHRIWHLPTSYYFGEDLINNGFVYYVQSTALSPYFNRYQYNNNRIIYALVTDAPLWLNASDVFPLIRMYRAQNIVRQVVLPIDFYVIVPFGLNHNSDFTFIIADNLTYHPGSDNLTVFAGYVRTTSISETARAYTSADSEQRFRVAAAVGARVFKFPAHQFGTSQLLPQDSILLPLCFTFELNEFDVVVFGYFDNRNTDFRPQLIGLYHWLRVRFVCPTTGYYYEGFVLANSVTEYRIQDGELGNREDFVTNATVIPAYFDDEYALGAIVFALDSFGNKMFCSYGYPVPHPVITSIAFGTRIMVIGRFNTSIEYHRIMYDSLFGTVIVYIRTPNIEYDGIDFLRLIVVGLCVATVILGGIATARYISVKKTFKPKEPAESFI